jgi:hypothetical protein
VPELLHHDALRDPLREQEGRRGVPQIVEAKALNARALGLRSTR